tara:strand:+ start:143 stop:679 length:537 start_codon:yes stop_codon:yes gene_type:complete
MDFDFDLHIKPIIKDSFILTSKIKDPSLMERLICDITMGVKEKDNSYKTNVLGKMTSFKYFNKNKNFLELIELMKPYLKKVIKTDIALKDSWGNILDKNDYVKMHNHEPAAVSGILYLSEGVPTHFPLYNKHIEAEVGKLVLFDPLLDHSVPKNKSSKRRYSLSFNFQTKGAYDHLNQ